MTIGYGDIIPKNDYEYLFVCLCFLIGVATFSISVSILSSRLYDLTSSVSKSARKMNNLLDLIYHYSIPDKLANTLIIFFSP
jgi:hypothetical protein